MAEPDSEKRERRVAATAAQSNDDIEMGDVNESGEGERKKPNFKKKSYIISEDEIKALRSQDQPKPQAPIKGLLIAVLICCVLTVIIVPSAFAGARANQGKTGCDVPWLSVVYWLSSLCLLRLLVLGQTKVRRVVMCHGCLLCTDCHHCAFCVCWC